MKTFEFYLRFSVVLFIFFCSIPSVIHAQTLSECPTSYIPCLISIEAQKEGIPPQIALYIAYKESGWNPNAIGDFGTSFGIFQIHDPESKGLTVEQALDPLTNIQWAMKTMAEDGNLHQWSTCKYLNVPSLCG